MKNTKNLLRLSLLAIIGLMLITCQKEEIEIFNSETENDNEAPQLKSAVYYQWYHLDYLTYNAINDLLAEGYLNKGNANALLVKYEAARENLKKGQYNTAEGILTAFINLVNALTEEGKISPEQGEELVLVPGAIIESFYYQCGDPIYDVRDGQTYETVKIGNQCWMAENLNFENEYSWWNKNDEENGEKYGRLYNLSVETYYFACPIGWHLPSDEEWKTLEKYLGMTDTDADVTGLRPSGDVGYKLKSTSGWRVYTDYDSNGDNSSEFSALPGGYGCGYPYPKFDGIPGYRGLFWSSTPAQNSGIKYWVRELSDFDYDYKGVYRWARERNYAYSIRCVKNE